MRLTKSIGRYTNETGQKILPSDGGLRADHRRSSTAPLVKDAGRRGRRPLRNPIGKPSVGADAYIGPPGYFPHPRQGTRALPYKMCGGPMCPAATGTSASSLTARPSTEGKGENEKICHPGKKTIDKRPGTRYYNIRSCAVSSAGRAHA